MNSTECQDILAQNLVTYAWEVEDNYRLDLSVK
uniref:Uncharacterized protein n=1 Tax=Anguilla anguilla TaxID=7936 RepID=A0A0E9QHE4_ANGAN